MQHRNRILIVDDSRTNVAILQQILGADHWLEVAYSGEEALAVAPRFQPALVLLDIIMSGIDGYETCRRLRTIPNVRGAKILMISAQAKVAERLQGYAAGADDYIVRPFDPEELQAKVRVYLRLKSVEEIDQLKTELLLLLSHKTRTPLNGIMAPVQMLVGETDLDATTRTDLLAIVQESVNHLCKLFKKAEILSAMKSGTWDFQFAPEDLCDVIYTAIGVMAAPAAERHIRIEQYLPATAPTMLDWPQMQNVVTTLIENALRFSPPHTRVVVRVQLDTTCCSLTVTDQGSGIAPALVPYVFEMGHHEDLMPYPAGDGLSLAIARQIVLAHNGTISVESTQGVGTTFTVQLPVILSPEARCA